MQIWRSFDDVPADLGRTVAVIGNFDGVHLGHRHVVKRAREIADERGLQVVDRDPERNILLVKGAVPGAVGSIVFVRPD